MKIIFIRHGESMANLQKIHQGQKIDTSLSKLGEWQARKTSEILKKENIGIIYASDLIRAKETAEIIAKTHGLQIRIDKRLRDLDTGNCAGTKIRLSEHFNQLRKEAKKRKIATNSLKFPGGESVDDHIARMKDFISEVVDCKKDVLLVAHGGTNKVLIAITKKEKNRDSVWNSKQKNACIKKKKKEGKTYKLISTNCTKHLSP